MDRILIYSIAAVLCAACMSGTVIAQDQRLTSASSEVAVTLDEVSLENDLGWALARENERNICPVVPERRACELAYDAVNKLFEAARGYLNIAKIAHLGEQQDEWKEKARWWTIVAEHVEKVALTDSLSLKDIADALSTARAATKTPVP